MVVGALRIVGWILGNPDPDCIGRVAFLENTSPRASAGQDCFVRGGVKTRDPGRNTLLATAALRPDPFPRYHPRLRRHTLSYTRYRSNCALVRRVSPPPSLSPEGGQSDGGKLAAKGQRGANIATSRDNLPSAYSLSSDETSDHHTKGYMYTWRTPNIQTFMRARFAETLSSLYGATVARVRVRGK